LHNPVKIPFAMFYQMRQVCFDKNIDGETLAWLALQRQVKLLHYLALRAIRTEEIFGADLVFEVGELVFQGCYYPSCLFVFGE